ncbi:TPA: MFS transporter [Burkholderia cenocepacia]|uniref:MFS transporter n=1 Tax=Burkholderia cenocepacia TaxID=95486 RepID=UPI0009B1FF5F|nr:MFS transporter [Burkholderia cenocepacia]MCW3693219.1 MFS transporter [Burkholderia cenocepacia]QUO29222.1 MFS transporter [Burkholderia cenocepacia]
MTTEIEKAVLRKVAWRFLPLLIVAYIVNYLDRTSLGVAALTMNNDLHLTASEFGYAAGIFFVGYCLFEVPSNLALYRYGAKFWLTRIIITWGIVSASTAWVSGPVSFYLVRFLLGVAEAGFFPGVAYFLSCWFPKAYRARILAWFLLAIPASSLIGTPIAGWLLDLNGVGGLAGWKWMFVLVSLPAIALGCIFPMVLANSPRDATWLTKAERTTLEAILAGESKTTHKSRFSEALRDPRVLILAATQFGLIVGSYGIGVWLPQIVREHIRDNHLIALVSTVPYLFATFGPIIWAAWSDKTDSKIGNVVAGCTLSAAGLLLSLYNSSLLVSMLGITLALLGINAARAIFWAIPPRFLTGAAAAGGFAFINSVGTIGGLVGPAMIGVLKDWQGTFTAGLLGMAVFLTLSAMLAASLKLMPQS